MTSSNHSNEALHLFLLQQDWAYEQAGQFFWKIHEDVALEQVILFLAEAGFFPTVAWFRRCEEVVRRQEAEVSGWLSEALTPDVPIEGFEARPYRIRTARLSDLPVLLELEEACWSDGLRAHADELALRLTGYPQGQLALELEGQVVGAIYSQRIVDTAALLHSNFRDVAALHDPAGRIAQPLAVNVLPAMQQYGLGDQLLEFLLQLATLNPAIERVAAVTLCKEYPLQGRIPMEEYIHQRNSYGLPVDPILAFHVAHGAQIRRTIDGYRPPDHTNLGKGVLVEYDLRNRVAARSAAAGPVAPLDRSAIPAKVEAVVRQVMPPQQAAAFSTRRPLRELGFSSLQLLELAMLLGQQLGIKLDASFFFRHSSVEEIVRYFVQRTEEAAPSWDRIPEDAATQREATRRSPYDRAVAIVGMACRFPGGVDSPAAFWQLLAAGRDAIGEVPASRWDIDAWHGNQAGQIVSRYGGFVDEVDQFDAPFFRIAPVEASTMDPQQRLLLETHWEALEDAGIVPAQIKGSATGIFVGLYADDYKLLQGLNLNREIGG